ncbi:hypothetical protein B0H21DRAFT_582602 [Amylocystis lapponica]|nr:hypothetical protein B0H21DRAFT_582602 [Amylocystis lapponica]
MTPNLLEASIEDHSSKQSDSRRRLATSFRTTQLFQTWLALAKAMVLPFSPSYFVTNRGWKTWKFTWESGCAMRTCKAVLNRNSMVYTREKRGEMEDGELNVSSTTLWWMCESIASRSASGVELRIFHNQGVVGARYDIRYGAFHKDNVMLTESPEGYPHIINVDCAQAHICKSRMPIILLSIAKYCVDSLSTIVSDDFLQAHQLCRSLRFGSSVCCSYTDAR